MRLITEAALAADFDLPVGKVAELRRRHRWPHVRFGRSDVRYTVEQVAAIVAMQTVETKPAKPVIGLPGQTSRSARRNTF